MNKDLIYDLTIKQGEDYSIDFIYAEDDNTPVDLTGWTIESVIREYPEAYDRIDFFCTSDSEGIHLYLGHDSTNLLTYSKGYYDVFITDPDNERRTPFITGRVSIIPRVAR